MARSFVASSAQCLFGNGGPYFTAPMTLVCFIRPSAAAVAASNMFCLTETPPGVHAGIYLGLAGSGKARAQTYDGSSANPFTTGATTFTAGVWQHLGATYAATGIKAYRNGSLDGTTGADARVAVSPTYWTVGAGSSAAPLYFDGDIAEVAVWSVELTAPEMAQLAAGVAPSAVRSAALIRYWPIQGVASPEPDLADSCPLTLANNPLPAPHPPMAPPTTGRMMLVF